MTSNKLSSDSKSDILTGNKSLSNSLSENSRLIHVSSEPIIENIDGLIEKERKSSIKDVLEVESSELSNSMLGRSKSSVRRQQEKEPVHYSIEDSSIIQRPPTRGGLER